MVKDQFQYKSFTTTIPECGSVLALIEKNIQTT